VAYVKSFFGKTTTTTAADTTSLRVSAIIATNTYRNRLDMCIFLAYNGVYSS
jgi:hypothetical protein